MSALASYATFIAGVRTALLLIGAFVAIICTVDWAVRTRRINPFSRVARFFRGRVDPLMAPVERVGSSFKVHHRDTEAQRLMLCASVSLW